MVDKARVNEFLQMQNSPHTRTTYGRALALWEEFGNNDGLAFKNILETKYAPATAATYWDGLRSFFDWLFKRGLITQNPIAWIKSPRRTSNTEYKVPTDDEVRRLLSCDWLKYELRSPSETPWVDLRDMSLMWLFANGLRVNEAVTLRRNAFEQSDAAILIHVIGKGDKARVVPLMDGTAEILSRYLWSVPFKNSEHVFVSAYGQPISVRLAQCIFQRVAKRAGVKGYSPHSLRHSYGTRMARNDVSPFVLQQLMGHESIRTTTRYVNLNRRDLIAAAQKDPLGGYDGQL